MNYVWRVIGYLRSAQEWFNRLMDLIVRHGRNAEWSLVLGQILMAYQLAKPGETLSLKTYQNVRDLGITDGFMVWLLMLVSVTHGAALWYNGRIERTPVWRGGCCAASTFILGLMAYLTWTSSMQTAGMLPGLFLTLSFLALTCCRLAGDDYRCLTLRQ